MAATSQVLHLAHDDKITTRIVEASSPNGFATITITDRDGGKWSLFLATSNLPDQCDQLIEAAIEARRWAIARLAKTDGKVKVDAIFNMLTGAAIGTTK